MTSLENRERRENIYLCSENTDYSSKDHASHRFAFVDCVDNDQTAQNMQSDLRPSSLHIIQ